MRRLGVTAMDPAHALSLMDMAVADGTPAVTAAQLDFTALREQGVPPLLRSLVTTSAQPAQDGSQSWRDRLANVPEPQRYDLLVELVRTEAGVVLGHADAKAVTADSAFKDAGFDSLTGVELRNRLTTITGVRLPATLVFDHPSPAALAAHLVGELGERQAEAAPVIAELRRLANAALAQRQDRAELAEFLKDCLARLQDSDDSDPAVADKLDVASDDEIFAFIDNEL
jgi:polyketide synthase 12